MTIDRSPYPIVARAQDIQALEDEIWVEALSLAYRKPGLTKSWAGLPRAEIINRYFAEVPAMKYLYDRAVEENACGAAANELRAEKDRRRRLSAKPAARSPSEPPTFIRVIAAPRMFEAPRPAAVNAAGSEADVTALVVAPPRPGRGRRPDVRMKAIEQMRRDIQTGKYTLDTLREWKQQSLADKYGVSRATAQAALRGV